MRIGIFTYGMGDKPTGIARYTAGLLHGLGELIEAGEALEPVLLNPTPASVLPMFRAFPNHPVPRLRRVPAAATLGNLTLHRTALELGLDVLHDPCGIAPFLWPRGPRPRYGRVTTVHDAVPFVHPETQPLATRLIFRTLVPAAGRTADAVLTVSEASARDLHEHAGIPEAKLHAVPLGVDPPPPHDPAAVAATVARLGLSEPYFLYVGGINPRKNVGRILDAFDRVRAAHPEAELAVVGPKLWDSGSVLARADATPGVTITGFVDDADLDALYRGARALVWPSLYEGFGLPPLEALARGTPVLTSNVSSLPEVVGDAGLQVDPTDVDAIAERMRRLLEDDALVADLRARGPRRAAGFSWRALAERTVEVYRAVAPRG